MEDAGLQFCMSVYTLPVTVAVDPLTCPIYTMHILQNFPPLPMPSHVLVDFVVFPPGHGRSVTDF